MDNIEDMHYTHSKTHGKSSSILRMLGSDSF